MEELLLSSPALLLYGVIIGYIINFAKSYSKKSENPYDDLAVNTFMYALEEANKMIDYPALEDLLDKAVEVAKYDDNVDLETEKKVEQEADKVKKQ